MLQSTTGGQVIADLDENNVHGQDESANIHEMIDFSDYNDNNNNSPR